jgi:hypothetical protein
LHDNEEMGDRDLIENTHATSEGSNGEYRRVDHHYADDVHGHCDDGGGSHDGGA